MDDVTQLDGREGHVANSLHRHRDRLRPSERGCLRGRGGPALLGPRRSRGFSLEVHYRCVPDDVDVISAVLIELCDEVGCAVVVTTGGTGPAARDVTLEATEAVD